MVAHALNVLTNMSLSVGSGSKSISAIVGSKVVVTQLPPHLLTIPLHGQWYAQRSESGD